MDDTQGKPGETNPFVYLRDEALETYARGIIDEAIAESAASPRNFSAFSATAAKRISEYVLANFERRNA